MTVIGVFDTLSPREGFGRLADQEDIRTLLDRQRLLKLQWDTLTSISIPRTQQILTQLLITPVTCSFKYLSAEMLELQGIPKEAEGSRAGQTLAGAETSAAKEDIRVSWSLLPHRARIPSVTDAHRTPMLDSLSWKDSERRMHALKCRSSQEKENQW